MMSNSVAHRPPAIHKLGLPLNSTQLHNGISICEIVTKYASTATKLQTTIMLMLCSCSQAQMTKEPVLWSLTGQKCPAGPSTGVPHTIPEPPCHSSSSLCSCPPILLPLRYALRYLTKTQMYYADMFQTISHLHGPSHRRCLCQPFWLGQSFFQCPNFPQSLQEPHFALL